MSKHWKAEESIRLGLVIWTTGGRAIAKMLSNDKTDANLIVAAPDQNDVLKGLAARIVICPTCDGNGTELNDPESACRTCGGIGRVLDATSLIQDIEEALAKAEGKKEAENKS